MRLGVIARYAARKSDFVCVLSRYVMIERRVSLSPVFRDSTRALRHTAPVALAEATSDALLATDAAEKILTLATCHRFGHLLPAIGLWRARSNAARRRGRRSDARRLCRRWRGTLRYRRSRRFRPGLCGRGPWRARPRRHVS